jgi:hypothetical protein
LRPFSLHLLAALFGKALQVGVTVVNDPPHFRWKRQHVQVGHSGGEVVAVARPERSQDTAAPDPLGALTLDLVEQTLDDSGVRIRRHVAKLADQL